MKVIFLLLLFFINIYAQNINYTNQLFVNPQGRGIESYNSLGFSNISNCTISEISSANPASLNHFNYISIGLSFQYSSKINLLNDFTFTSTKQWFPASFGFVYPYKNFRFGLAYHQRYNSYINYGENEITTIEHPDGTGEFFSATSERIIHSPSSLINYTINGIFNDSDYLSLGLQLFWDFLKINEKIYITNGQLKDNNMSWKLGIIYEFKQETHIGIIYEKGVTFEGEYKIEPQLTTIIHANNDSYVNVNPIYFLKLPDKLVFGVTNQTLNNFLLSMTISSIFWESVYDGYQNQLDISSGVIYKLSDLFRISLGFYNSDLIYKNPEYHISNNTNFIGAGMKWYINHLDIQFEVIGSHLFSSEYRKQTQIKLGLNYAFN